MDKSKFLFFVGSLILVCLACAISLTDTTNNIHYYRPDICEFSDRSGKSGNNKKSKIIITAIDKSANNGDAHPIPSHQEYHLFIFFNMFNKYIDLDKYQKILHPPGEIYLSFMHWNKPVVEGRENIFPLIGNCSSSHALQIITTSIIRS